MRMVTALLAVTLLVVDGAALADEPPASNESSASPVASADNSKVRPASTAQPTASTTQSSAETAEKHLRAMGYKPEMQNGVQVYCKREMPVGSRVYQKVCTTPEQQAKQDALGVIKWSQSTILFH